MRLFVAVTPPPEVLDAIATLPRPDEPGVRWVPREQWHVTLRFLGDADPDAVAAALDGALGDGADRVPHATGARCELGPVVSRLGRSVVCVPASGLDELARVVTTATAHLGTPPDPRPFTGHLTLARLRQRAACGVTGAPFRASFDVRDVDLVESRLGSDGATHTRRGRWPV
ncbi:MAG TPA: RNA 2',3'-cyclic phosphodiesterase [Acidimicrobiales bacterium]|nr:RNA 2',3'-cyclic phosphodiesterase [Acidimicrobiales bacterium]